MAEIEPEYTLTYTGITDYRQSKQRNNSICKATKNVIVDFNVVALVAQSLYY